MTLKERLRLLKKRSGLSFDKLAKKAGLSRKTVELALSDPGSRTVRTMQKIASALGVSLQHLFDTSPPWEEARSGHRRKTSLRIHEELLAALDRKAKEIGISRAALIESVLQQAVRMYRVQCPNCEGVFWVEKERGFIVCPYCCTRGRTTLDDFVVQ